MDESLSDRPSETFWSRDTAQWVVYHLRGGVLHATVRGWRILMCIGEIAPVKGVLHAANDRISMMFL